MKRHNTENRKDPKLKASKKARRQKRAGSPSKAARMKIEKIRLSLAVYEMALQEASNRLAKMEIDKARDQDTVLPTLDVEV